MAEGRQGVAGGRPHPQRAPGVDVHEGDRLLGDSLKTRDSNVLIAFFLAAVVAIGVQAAPADRFEFKFSELSLGVWAGVRENSSQFPVMGSATFVIT